MASEFGIAFGRFTTILGSIVMLCYFSLFFYALLLPKLQRILNSFQSLPQAVAAEIVGRRSSKGSPSGRKAGDTAVVVHSMLLKHGAPGWQTLAHARRLEYSRLLLQFMVHVGALMLLVLLGYRYSCGWLEPECSGVEPAWDSVSLVSVLMAMGLMFWTYPKHFTLRRRDVVHLLAMIRLAWQATDIANPYLLVFQRYTLLGLRLALGIILGNLPVTFALNASYSIYTAWTYLHMLPEDDTLPAKLFTEGHQIWFIFDEVWITMLICAVCYAIESRTNDEAQATAQMRVSKQAEVTLQSILDAVCDAIVHVGTDFVMLDGSTQINSLLLRAGGRSWSGTSFMEIVDSVDRGRLAAHLLASNKDVVPNLANEAADWMVVRIVDSYGVRINAQIFHCRLLGALDECLGFLLGIRELSVEDAESPNLFSQAHSSDSRGTASRDSRSVSSASPPEHISVRSSGSGGRYSSSGATTRRHSIAGVLLEVVEDDQSTSDPVVWFRADDLTILRGTAAFAVLGGPAVAGTSFSDWIINKVDVLSQLQELINSALHEDDYNQVLQVHGVGMRVPTGRRLEYIASCRFNLEKVSDDVRNSIENIVVRTDLIKLTPKVRRSGLATAGAISGPLGQRLLSL